MPAELKFFSGANEETEGGPGTGRLLGHRRAGTPTPPSWTDSNLAPHRPSKAAAGAAPASLLPHLGAAHWPRGA